MQKRKQQLFLYVWLVCAVAAAWFYYHWHVARDYVGIVEAISHPLGAREAGIIKEMFVSVKDKVDKGQILASLDVSDLDTELELLEKELDSAIELQDKHKKRYLMELQALRMQLENENSDMSERMAILDSKQTELQKLASEIDRLKNAQKAGLGYNRDLFDLELQREALESFLKSQSQEMQSKQKKQEVADNSKNILSQGEDETIVNSLLEKNTERCADLRREIAYVQNRKLLRTIISPCEGHVVEISAQLGDVVEEFVPILTVMETESRFINVYVPEKSGDELEDGMNVEVCSVRSGVNETSGCVEFVHPGIEMVPERLTMRGQLLWARTVRVSVAADNLLIPGEVVHIRVGGANGSSHERLGNAYASASPDPGHQHESNFCREIRQMQVPQSITSTSRFEPSGIVWMPHKERFLIVSDDTGKKDAPNEHCPVLFAMDVNGTVDPSVLNIAGLDTINDLESITALNNSSYYILSSQNISKQQSRKPDRRALIKIQKTEDGFETEGEIDLLALILNSFPENQLESLGLSRLDEDGLPTINIEGSAYKNGSLFLGLKLPVLSQGAIIWELKDPESAIQKGKINPWQLALYGNVQLKSSSNHPGGISDMAFDSNGRMWILSTIPNVDETDQMGGLFIVTPYADGHLTAKLVCEFPGRKPEGICFFNDTKFIVVFDTDQNNPEFLIGDVDKV